MHNNIIYKLLFIDIKEEEVNLDDKIIIVINNIRNNILEYNLNLVFIEVNGLITELLTYAQSERIPQEKVNDFNTILMELVTSFENKDYLLLSDILKYKLIMFLENI